MAETSSDRDSLGAGKSNRSYFEIWLTAVPMVAICMTTIMANGAILTMFFSRRGLRRCKNLYFANLALADFLVGLCMPFQMANDLHQSWNPSWACRLFQTIKQSIMYVSFASIFLLTLDKWRAIHYPSSYRKKQSKRTAVAAVIIAWVISLIVFSIPQIWWDDFMLEDTSTSDSALRHSSNLEKSADSLNHKETTQGRKSGTAVGGVHTHNLSQRINTRIGQGSKIYRSAICPEGYYLGFHLSVFTIYIIPILAMILFDVSLFFKIRWRKSVEVQRSTSVTDTYFMTLKKPALDFDSCVPSGEDDPAKESLLKNFDNKLINKHLAIGARGERRHSSLPAISPIIKGRTSSGRRVSMPEGNASGAACRYVGRKWSGCAAAVGTNQTPNPMANLAPRIHNEDMVHDILVKQDQKAVTYLCLLLGTVVICWLPQAVVRLAHTRCRCLYHPETTITSWLFLLGHAVNPFLYGLMNAQFKNVLKQWLLIERVHAFRMRDTLILKNLQKKVVCDDTKDKSPNQVNTDQQFELPPPDSDQTLL